MPENEVLFGIHSATSVRVLVDVRRHRDVVDPVGQPRCGSLALPSCGNSRDVRWLLQFEDDDLRLASGL
jgi:hypothetical protein